MSGCYEPPGPKTPWYSRRLGGPGGFTLAGWVGLVVLAAPFVFGLVLLVVESGL